MPVRIPEIARAAAVEGLSMECPKCGGGAFLSEEELVQVMANTQPIKVVLKAVYVCRACSEKFSRLVCENLEAKRKTGPDNAPVSNMPANTGASSDPAEGLKFF